MALLFTSRIEDLYRSYEELTKQYKQCCADNNLNFIEDHAMDWAQEEIDLMYQNFIDGVPDIDCLMLGRYGLWNGAFEGGRVGKLKELLQQEQYDDIRISYDEPTGVINMTGWHHDGSNDFTIYNLTKKGWNYHQRHFYDEPRPVHKYLKETRGCVKKIKLWNI